MNQVTLYDVDCRVLLMLIFSSVACKFRNSSMLETSLKFLFEAEHRKIVEYKILYPVAERYNAYYIVQKLC